MVHKVFYIFWKDLLMRKNHYIATTLEVALPISLIILANLTLPKHEIEVDNNLITFEAFSDKKCTPRHSFYGVIIYEPSTPFTDSLMTKAACYAGYKKTSKISLTVLQSRSAESSPAINGLSLFHTMFLKALWFCKDKILKFLVYMSISLVFFSDSIIDEAGQIIKPLHPPSKNVKPGKLSDNSTYFSIGVRFENVLVNSSTIPNILNYTLFPTSKVWTNLIKLWRYSGVAIPRFNIPTLHTIVEIQRAIDTSYLNLRNISSQKIILENTDLYDRSPRIFSVAIYLSLFIAFSLMVPPIVSRIVQEKYTGSKELMLMMGVMRWQLWVAKFLDTIFFHVITVSGILLFLYVPLKEDANYLTVSFFLCWSVIMYGMIGVIFFLFFMTCFFEKSTLAVYVTEIIWSFSFIFNNFISAIIELPVLVKYLMCFFPHVSLMQGVSILLDFNFYGKTVKLTERLSEKEDGLSLLNVLIIMSVNIILYAVLTWYLEQVKPGKFGVPQPYNFCFKKSYWIPSKVLTSYNNSALNKSPANFEPVPPGLQIGVSIQNASKIYKSLDKGIITAVDDVSLDFYHSEISALLGHNGAGKTTIFSMITGLSYPTSGKIIINGYDLGVNVCEARRSLGLCPQQDMLFNDLTTLQILKFYGVVKGLSLKQANNEALDLIKKLKLMEVKNTQAVNLSGGQKRKVSLAIALIGGSEVLVLDEPTAGMDPEIRREIWEILLGFRGARTILLTTHFMEEADALCDRIAIMDHGKIKSYGSPMFLKRKYGKGYVLNVVLLDLDKSKELVGYIKEFIPSAKFKSQNIRTLTFELPESEVTFFPALLSGLEEKQSKNEVASYCISLATLEDVFLRLRSGHEETDDFDTIDSPAFKKINMHEDFGLSRPPSHFLYFFQLWALIIKKWIFFRRMYKSFLMYSILPALIVILTVSFSTGRSHSDQETNLSGQKPLSYALDLYPSSLILYSNPSDIHKKELLKSLVKSAGSSAREVNNTKEGILNIFKDDFYTYAKKLVLAVDFSPRETHLLHNEVAVHMVPVSLNFWHNFLLKYWFKNDSIETSINIAFANKELYFVSRSLPKCMIEDFPDFSGTQTMFYLMEPIKERLYGAKGIQLMITTASLYWLSHLIFDVASFFVYITVLYLGLGVGLQGEFMLQHAHEILAGFLFWGTGLILLTYVLSTVIKDVAAAFSVNVIIYVVYTFIIYNAVAWEGLPKIFQYFHPTCILKAGFSDLCAGKESNFLLSLFLFNCGLFFFLVVKDSKLLSRIVHLLVNRFTRVHYSPEEVKDDLVKEEEGVVKKLITKGNISESVLIVNELKRWYFRGFQPCPAVKGISFAVNRGECFGLLGVNGAGKTSTFRMLTGALPPSHGSAYICSQKLTFFNRQKYLFSVGYCPQFGGLIPTFKGKELLTFFARLRGVSEPHLQQEVDKWLEKLNLSGYANQKCGTYSGGNQRKLSTAIALIGDSPLIFLDEPTSGVDPLSRRNIWNVIEEIQKEGQSVVLTSHSMDECEALCTRLAIMVSGRFRCIGETTTLKEKFGQGYCIQLKISNGAFEETVNSLKTSVCNAFEPGCELVDEHLTVLQYHVTNKSISWADLFSKLNVLRESYSILESYTASATTLEQIFIHFARNQ